MRERSSACLSTRRAVTPRLSLHASVCLHTHIYIIHITRDQIKANLRKRPSEIREFFSMKCHDSYQRWRRSFLCVALGVHTHILPFIFYTILTLPITTAVHLRHPLVLSVPHYAPIHDSKQTPVNSETSDVLFVVVLRTGWSPHRDCSGVHHSSSRCSGPEADSHTGPCLLGLYGELHTLRGACVPPTSRTTLEKTQSSLAATPLTRAR